MGSDTDTSTATTTAATATAATTSTGSTGPDATTGFVTSAGADPTLTTEPTCGICPADQPYCYGAQCISCSNSLAPCVEISGDPQTPVCDPSTGLCGECNLSSDCAPPTPLCDVASHTCVACLDDVDCQDKTLPLCDPSTHTCVSPCTEHSQCSVACELDTQRCFPHNTPVYHAAPGSGCEGNSGCTELSPCCDLQKAIERALQDAPNLTYVAVRLHTAKSPNTSLTTIGGAPQYNNKVFALLGDPGATIETSREPPNHPPIIFLNMATGSKIFLANLAISTVSSGAGISCLHSQLLWIDDTTIEAVSHPAEPVQGSGVFAAGCRLVTRRLLLRGNERGMHVTEGAEVELINTIIGGSLVEELFVGDNVILNARHVTLVHNSLTPDGILTISSAKSLNFVNSALLSKHAAGIKTLNNPPTITYSAVTDMAFALNTNKFVLMDQIMAPFLQFDKGDWRLGDTVPNILADVARWTTESPPTDFEGALRPAGEGMMDFAGADRPGSPP